MNCSKHHDREAKGMCVRCNRLICEECAVKINNKYYCKECVSEMYSTDNENDNTYNNNSNNMNYTNDSNLGNNINEINNPNNNQEQLDLGKVNSYTNVNVSDSLYRNSNNNSQENLYSNYQTNQYGNTGVKIDRKYKEASYVLSIIAIALLIPKVVLAIGGFADCFENMYLSIRYDEGVRALFFFINSLLTLIEPLIIIALAALSFKNFRIIAPIAVVAIFTLLIFITGNIALRFIYISPFISMLSYIIPVALIVIANCLDKE